MVSKLFILFLSVLAGIFAGLALSNLSGKRKSYFEELVGLVERLISDIKFSQSTIEEILGGYQCQSLCLQKNIDEYLEFLHGSTLLLSRGVLTKREHLLVSGFFERLGRLDLETQLDELELRKEVFKDIHVKTKEKNLRLSKAYIKIGFLFGLLVGILLI